MVWKKTDGSTIFAVRCCFRVTGAISEHYSFVETLNFAISKNITSWMFLHLAIWVCRALELGQIEIIPSLQDGIVHVWDSWLEKMNARRQRCLLPHPPTALFDLASDIRTKENCCICTNLSVCPAKYNKMLMIRETLWRLLDVQYARNTLH